MSTAITTIPQAAITENNLEEKAELIKSICAKDCSSAEFGLLCHLAVTYQLDPLARQIWAVKVPGYPAQIFAGRDGYLAIAHRSGVFDGMESGTKKDPESGELIGWATVYRKDVAHAFSEEVYFGEYARGLDSDKKSLWKDKPRTMIQKVAEAQALRKAFSISGLYSPEEISEPAGHVSTCAGAHHSSPAPTTYVRTPPKLDPKDAAAKPAEVIATGDSQYVGNATDCMHCFRCGRELQGAEPMVSKRDYQQYLCIGCMKAIDAAVSPSKTVSEPAAPKGGAKPSPAAPQAVAESALVTMDAENPKAAQRDQPSSSPLASEIARINARQERIDKAPEKKPMPAIKPDPHAGIVNTCQTCGENISQEQVRSSLAVSKFALCGECVDLMQDCEAKKPAGV